MESVAKMREPTTDAYVRRHPDVWAILGYREHEIPWGIRLSVTQTRTRRFPPQGYLGHRAVHDQPFPVKTLQGIVGPQTRVHHARNLPAAAHSWNRR